MTIGSPLRSTRRNPAGNVPEGEVVQLFPKNHDSPHAENPRAGRREAAGPARRRLRLAWLRGRRRLRGQEGMATAEYAIATLGAVAFAGLLVVILRSDEVRGFLLNIIRSALSLP